MRLPSERPSCPVPAPGRSRRGLRRERRRFGAAAAVVAALAVLVGACGNVSFDYGAAEATIRGEFKERTGADPIAVSCPRENKIDVVKGATFTCTVATGDGAVQVTGMLTDNNGAFTWKAAFTKLDPAAVAQQIEADFAKSGNRVSVVCPPKVSVGVGESFRCVATEGSTRAALRVYVVDDSGKVRWERSGT